MNIKIKDTNRCHVTMARRALTAVERENVRALDEFTAGLTVFTMALGAVQTFFMMWIQQEHLKLLQQGMT